MLSRTHWFLTWNCLANMTHSSMDIIVWADDILLWISKQGKVKLHFSISTPNYQLFANFFQDCYTCLICFSMKCSANTPVWWENHFQHLIVIWAFSCWRRSWRRKSEEEEERPPVLAPKNCYYTRESSCWPITVFLRSNNVSFTFHLS